MCTTHGWKFAPDFTETLNSELKTIYSSLDQRLDGHSWCSNPYIETMTGGFASNCIGCHQYAGRREIAPSPIPLDKRFNDFPGSFLTSFDRSQDGSGLADDIIAIMDQE